MGLPSFPGPPPLALLTGHLLAPPPHGTRALHSLRLPSSIQALISLSPQHAHHSCTCQVPEMKP